MQCKLFACLQFVMNMSDDDPRRMDEIRKYAAIYGRFDCKRKPEKPLTLHEVSHPPFLPQRKARALKSHQTN
jgi:hypothetical protein